MWDTINGKRQLKRTAVPTIFAHAIQNIEKPENIMPDVQNRSVNIRAGVQNNGMFPLQFNTNLCIYSKYKNYSKIYV